MPMAMQFANAPAFGRLLTFSSDPAGFRNGASLRYMLQQLTFVDSIPQITMFDLPAVRNKFSCKNTSTFTARRELRGCRA
jgi:hypothetical protein